MLGLAEQGPFAVVVSNAGIAPTAPGLKTSPEMWDRVIATNLTGAYNLAQAALPAMKEAGHCRFVAVASTASLRADPQAKTLGEYLRAKVVDVPVSIVRVRTKS